MTTRPNKIVSDVTAFHVWSEDYKGKSFWVLPFDERLGQNLEFITYAERVSAHLEAWGLRRERTMELPDLVVYLGYAIDDGQVRSFTYPIWNPTVPQTTSYSGNVYSGGRSASYSGTVTTQPQSLGYVTQGVGQRMVYRRVVQVGITAANWESPEKRRVVWESKAISEGSSGNLPEVMPGIIDTIFQDFPSESGKTYTRTGVFNQ